MFRLTIVNCFSNEQTHFKLKYFQRLSDILRFRPHQAVGIRKREFHSETSEQACQLLRCDWFPHQAKWGISLSLQALDYSPREKNGHIINPLYTKPVRSTLLYRCLVLLGVIMHLDYLLIHKRDFKKTSVLFTAVSRKAVLQARRTLRDNVESYYG